MSLRSNASRTVPDPPPPTRGPRHVVSVAEAGPEAVRLLADRRDAEVLAVRDLATLAGILRSELEGTLLVVVDAADAPADDLLDVADAAAARTDPISLGIIRARGPCDLVAMAERIPPEPSVGPGDGLQRLFLAPDQPLTLDGARIRAPRGSPGSRAGNASEVVYLAGHANSMHLCLEDAVVCCRPDGALVDPDELAVYPCFHGDPCAYAANRGARRMAPHDLASRRIVSLACFGATTGDRPFTPRYGVGEALLALPGLEAALATARAATVDSADLAYAYYLINSGVDFGQVAVRINAARRRRGRPPDILCFGDPETRIDATVAEVDCRRDGDLLTLEVDAARGAARDLVGHLPGDATLPARPVLVDESSGELLNAVLDPAGAIFVTVPQVWYGQPVQMRVVDREQLTDPSGTGRGLAEDLGFLDLYLPCLREANGSMSEMVALERAASALRERLRSWPLADLALFESVEARQVRATWRQLRRLVETLGDRFSDCYVALMSRDDRTHPTPWDSRVETVETFPSSIECAYCGNPADEYLMQARLGRTRRRWALCPSACAYLYDGDPELGRWIEAPEVVEAGRRNELAISTRNPYGMPLSVHVAGVLKHFDHERITAVRTDTPRLDPGSPTRATIDLDVPEDFTTGIYHLSACLMIGTRVNFFRTQLRVRNRTALQSRDQTGRGETSSPQGDA